MIFSRLQQFAWLCGVALMLLFNASIQAQVQHVRQYVWEDVPRIVAVGDIHGAYRELVALLKANELIDDALRWQGGKTHFVSLGDLVDRGPDSAQVIELYQRLQTEALAAGGRVHVLLGNHELMNLTGDVRDVSEAEFAALGGADGHRQAFALTGRFGAWLVEQPAVIRINDTLFVHGGLSETVRGQTLAGLNAQIRQHLLALVGEGRRLQAAELLAAGDVITAIAQLEPNAQAALPQALQAAFAAPNLGEFGPLWYRGTAACHEVIEEPVLERALTAFGASRVVIAHTPTHDREVNTRFDGRVFAIDTGMLASVYKGNARLLEFFEGGVRALGVDGEVTIHPSRKSDPVEVLRHEEVAQVSNVEGKIIVRLATSQLEAEFVRANERGVARGLARYRLDRALQLYFTPATVQREIAGRAGLLVLMPKRQLLESKRIAEGYRRPNYCQGTSDYLLLAGFDALTGMRGRNTDNMYYALPSWQLLASDIHKGFGTSKVLPKYSQVPVLAPGMLKRLAGLTGEGLNELLGDLLKPKEIQAILSRRDAILKHWSGP